jgi:hypothetical protein
MTRRSSASALLPSVGHARPGGTPGSLGHSCPLPISRGSRWNRAVVSKRLTAVCAGAMSHIGRNRYLDANAFTGDGRSYLDVTASTMLAIIRRTAPAGAGPSQSHDPGII